jgi:predicted CXXCH cytochrome family protein
MLLLCSVSLIASRGAADAQLDGLRRMIHERGKTHEFGSTDCRSCHSNPALRDELASLHAAGDEPPRDFGLYIDLEKFRKSIHYRAGKKECTDCHRGNIILSSRTGAQRLSCFYCHRPDTGAHAEARGSVARSVHAEFMRGRCAGCHSPHEMRRSEEIPLDEKNGQCLRCHDRVGKDRRPLVERHRWHPEAALHLTRVACLACHTQPGSPAFKHRILPKKEAIRDCAQCHGLTDRLSHYREDIRDLEQLYISGVTRHPLVDGPGLVALAAVCFGVTVHGVLRLVAWRRRRKRP